MAEGKKLAIGVFCADWRLHQSGVHINNAVKDYLGVDGIDVLAVAGPDGVLSPERKSGWESLNKNLQLLIDAHRPASVAFVAHYTCAGHPVSDDNHDRDVEQTLRAFKDSLKFDGELVGLCATYVSDNEWPLKEIVRI